VAAAERTAIRLRLISSLSCHMPLVPTPE